MDISVCPVCVIAVPYTATGLMINPISIDAVSIELEGFPISFAPELTFFFFFFRVMGETMCIVCFPLSSSF